MNRRLLFSTAITIFIACILWGVAILSLGEPPYWVLIITTVFAIVVSQVLTEYLRRESEEINPTSQPNAKSKPTSAEDEDDLKNQYKRVVRQKANLQARLDEQKMLRQFDEALNFTISFDGMLWLIYTNCIEAVNGRDFRIYIRDDDSNQLYTAFYADEYESKERRRVSEYEGIHRKVYDERIIQVVDIGQVWEYKDNDNRAWLVAPLNSGATSVGAIEVSHPELGKAFSPQDYEIITRLSYQAANSLDNWKTNRRLQIRAGQMESLVEVIRTITAVLSVEELLKLALDKAVELLEVESGSFLLVDEQTGKLNFVAVTGPAGSDLKGSDIPFGRGIASKVAKTGEAKMVNDVADTGTWYKGIDEQTSYKTESILTVPLKSDKAVLGVLQIVNRLNEQPFTKDDQELLSAFADAAVVALNNARLHEQTDIDLQNRVNELSLLQQMDRDLNSTIEVEATFTNILGWLKRLYEADAGAIMLFTAEDEWLSGKEFGYPNTLNSLNLTFETLPKLMEQAMESSEPIMSVNLKEDEESQPLREETQSQIILPILIDGKSAGIVSIEKDTTEGFTDFELQSATTLINHCAPVLANARLYHRVQTANYAKSEFVSIVSHELKNPLTSIKGYGDLLLSGLSGKLTDQQIEFVKTIHINVRRMNRLIKDLTDASRIDTGELSIEPSPMPFNTVISDTITTIQAVADKKNIKIHLDMLSHSPIVYGDQERLVQVMSNLMSNACKYSPDNSNIYVAVSNGNNQVKLSVRDEGYGISSDDQAKMFTRFFRSEDPNIRKATGTGLGLSISREIIEKHGGELDFTSDLEAGTEFWFTVPLAD